MNFLGFDGNERTVVAACPNFIFALRSTTTLAAMVGMETILRHRHRAVTISDLIFIRQLIANHPAPRRRDLSKKLCRAWNWVQTNGALRNMVCRSLMLKLHRTGHIELPPARYVQNNPLARRAKPAPGRDRRHATAHQLG